MSKLKEKMVSGFYTIVAFLFGHKAVTLVSIVLLAAIVAGTIVLPDLMTTSKRTEVVSDAVANVEEIESNLASSKETTASGMVTSDKITSTESKNPMESKVSSSDVVSVESEKPAESKVESTVSKDTTSDKVTSTESEKPAESKVESTGSKDTTSKKVTSAASKKPSKNKDKSTENKPSKKPVAEDFKMTPENNVFLDALEYTGYQLDVQRKSGMMWGSFDNYILCSQKKGLGWLSDITYDDYGRASGYETNKKGKPDISYFEKTGLVCASYATYVYFNYLPNVAGVDTSMLAKPNRSVSANDWYIAGKKWVDKGYSRYIDFTANDGGSIDNDIKLKLDEDIPIGSLIVLCDWYNRSDWCSHICIYAGKKNGYHWVTHVGNENGPEFCAIERMNRKPHPQWPIAIITTPQIPDLIGENKQGK